MARPLRIEYVGAVYHVMARGNQGQPIFRDDKDRRRFLETLGEAAEKTGWRILRTSCAYSSGVNVGATYDSLNRLMTLSDPVGATSFGYQNFGAFQGALSSEDGPWASDIVGHHYANRLPQNITLQQPSGSWSLIFGYDNVMRLGGLTSSSAGLFKYAYNGAGNQIQSLTMPGGNLIAYGYDNAGYLTSSVLKNGATVLDSYNYTIDANGNHQTMTRTDNSTVTYGYDDMQELISAVGAEASGAPRANETLGQVSVLTIDTFGGW